jgi:hypothetical protein
MSLRPLPASASVLDSRYMASLAPRDDPNTDTAISVVLPVDSADPALGRVLLAYAQRLPSLTERWELLLVARTQAAATACEQLVADETGVRTTTAADGWGAAVRSGLRASVGELLCYTNWRRTPPDALTEMLELGLRNPGLVLRANRRTRDTRVRRLGSLLFNVECRVLLQTPAWDVNGTPKVFPRAFAGLLALERDDELIDAEFALVCEREGYPVVEVPIDAMPQSAAAHGVDYGGALRMYVGLARLRERGIRAQARTP